MTRVEVRGHRAVGRVALVLLVDHAGLPLQGLQRPGRRSMTPCRSQLAMQLAGDAQRRAVLHEGHVVDVRDLGAADALVDPADDVAEDRLGVVVDLGLPVLGAPAGGGRRAGCVSRSSSGGRRRLASSAAGPERRPGGSAGRAASPPSGTAPRRWWRRRSGWAIFCCEHVGHEVGHRPHALADLGPGRQPAGEADVDVPSS